MGLHPSTDDIFVDVQFKQADKADKVALRLVVEPGIVFQGGSWHPGVTIDLDHSGSLEIPAWVVTPEGEADENDPMYLAEVIAYSINEGGEKSGSFDVFEGATGDSGLVAQWSVRNPAALDALLLGDDEVDGPGM